MPELHALIDFAVAISATRVPRGLAWLTAIFGSPHYSDRAMRLLRRPPVESRDQRKG